MKEKKEKEIFNVSQFFSEYKSSFPSSKDKDKSVNVFCFKQKIMIYKFFVV